MPPNDTTPLIDHGRTPENTPLPGGGRWRWDDASGAWASLDAPAEPVAADTTTPAQE